MLATIRNLAPALVACCLPIAAVADETLHKHVSDDDLIHVLEELGFRAVGKVEDRVLSLRIDGYLHYLYIYDDDDLQLYFGLTGYEISPSDVNEWNRTRRLSRAYLDDVNDPVVEADLLANAGYTAEQLAEWIAVFDRSAREFHDFVAATDRGRRSEFQDLSTADVGEID